MKNEPMNEPTNLIKMNAYYRNQEVRASLAFNVILQNVGL